MIGPTKRNRSARLRAAQQQPTCFCRRCRAAAHAEEPACVYCGAPAPEKGWPPLADLGDPWLGRTIDGRYRVTRRIGRGTFADVYRIDSVSIARHFAIKIIDTDRGDADPEAIIARLDREVDALSQLRNPHIVSFYEILDLGGGHIGVIMDLVDGVTLQQLVSQGQPLSTHRAYTILRQVANGLLEAHKRQMIHRDLKPDNIMVERLPAGDDFARILDFGVVSTTGSSTVRLTHGFVGTPLYASPEQIQDLPLDWRSDIYSLGAILFFMLTGHPPFPSNNTYDVLRMHLEKPPPRLASVVPWGTFPPSLEALVAAMLAKDRQVRPADLSLVIAALDRLTLEETSEAHLDNHSTIDRNLRPLDRHGQRMSHPTNEHSPEPIRRHRDTPLSGVLKLPSDFGDDGHNQADSSPRKRSQTPLSGILKRPSRRKNPTPNTFTEPVE